MLASLLARLAPRPGRTTDDLFTPFAPHGPPVQVLRELYHRYEDALDDEFVPAQHVHYRALCDRLLGVVHGWERLEGLRLRRVISAYVACFEQSEAFQFQLSLWRDDAAFVGLLSQVRAHVTADLQRHAERERARRRYYSRWDECMAAPTGLFGVTRLDFIKQMGPDDWHEAVLSWDWDDGIAGLEWITAQRDCDRATATFALCSGRPGEVALRFRQDSHDTFVRDLAARLEGGFYPVAELSLALPMRTIVSFEHQLEIARATGVSPWQLPAGLVAHVGCRQHRPRYVVEGNVARFHYGYWLEHLAPRARC